MRIPTATYRFQIQPAFDLHQATELVDYLDDLGISDIYLSPIFASAKGSAHGYDVVDPTSFNAEIGGQEAVKELHAKLKQHNMGWLQDIVPNHMAYNSDNVMLMDVLENGPASQYAHIFDINWEHVYQGLQGRVLAPFLGSFYGEALEGGDIRLAYDQSGLSINYYELRLPVRIESYVQVFTHNLSELEQSLGQQHPDLIRYLGTVHTLDDLPGSEQRDDRYRRIRLSKKLLWELYTTNSQIGEFIDSTLDVLNGTAGDSDSFNDLDRLLNEQYFRLAFWKVATQEINYRRFFTINDLICIRLEDRTVFDQTHSLLREMAEEDTFTGLRIDHIDGLLDPQTYLQWLDELAPNRFVVVEKILEEGEELPDSWQACGTTGYDFLNVVNKIQLRSENQQAFDKLYGQLTGIRVKWPELVARKKRLMVDKHLAGNIENLAYFLKSISGRNRHGNDITLYGLRRALVEVMSYFPIYRTYVTEDHFSQADRDYITQAVDLARLHNPGLLYELNFIKHFLLLDHSAMATEQEREQAVDFVMRFQQVTGPLAAKGVEDTCLYIYNRLLSLNEVGSDPSHFGVSPQFFHGFNQKRLRRCPQSMSTTATHDTKRGEDARCRLNVLSEMPEEWEHQVRLWRRLNTGRKMVQGTRAPDKNDEYLLYQSLIAHWPFANDDPESFVRRMQDFAVKAVREAKVHTAWIKPDAAYEKAFTHFIEHILLPAEHNRFLEAFLPFWRKIAWYGMLNSLSQVVLKITSPGVPDFYQGCELWDLSMVDPDNRRPVDFASRKRILERIGEPNTNTDELLKSLRDEMHSGAIKLYTIQRSLSHRHNLHELYANGEYIPLVASGPLSNHVVAFARSHESVWSLVVVPRLMTDLVGENQFPHGRAVWKSTCIQLPETAPNQWRNIFTGKQVDSDDDVLPIAGMLADFPVCILEGRNND
ncbi:malto-oligosyltrehalose synthase [candidate division GN15 bacterium]|nr:malto-oligosyltrehalose synthase [candidate division GN15 bacterium]